MCLLLVYAKSLDYNLKLCLFSCKPQAGNQIATDTNTIQYKYNHTATDTVPKYTRQKATYALLLNWFSMQATSCKTAVTLYSLKNLSYVAQVHNCLLIFDLREQS